MNVSIRPALKSIICSVGGGSKAGLSLCAKSNLTDDDEVQELND